MQFGWVFLRKSLIFSKNRKYVSWAKKTKTIFQCWTRSVMVIFTCFSHFRLFWQFSLFQASYPYTNRTTSIKNQLAINLSACKYKTKIIQCCNWIDGVNETQKQCNDWIYVFSQSYFHTKQKRRIKPFECFGFVHILHEYKTEEEKILSH